MVTLATGIPSNRPNAVCEIELSKLMTNSLYVVRLAEHCAASVRTFARSPASRSLPCSCAGSR